MMADYTKNMYESCDKQWLTKKEEIIFESLGPINLLYRNAFIADRDPYLAPLAN